MKTYILTCPGRPQISSLMGASLSRQNPGEPWFMFQGSGRNGAEDFFRLLYWAGLSGQECLLLEDDIVTAKNFIRYVKRWKSPHLTSFFFEHGPGIKTGVPESPATFGCNQALWFPAGLISRLGQAGRPVGARLQDDALAAVLGSWGEKVFYHPKTLVKHIGTTSLCRPGGREITAPNFVGEEFDCMELLNG